MGRPKLNSKRKEALSARHNAKSNSSTNSSEITPKLEKEAQNQKNKTIHRKKSNKSYEEWKPSIGRFTKRKISDDSLSKIKSKPVKSYYEAQNELITSFEQIQMGIYDDNNTSDSQNDLIKRSSMLAQVTFSANVLLMIAKIAAVAASGSISVISSLVDSIMDLTSGIVIWWSTRSINQKNPYKYPQGKTRLEPIAVIILSVVMALASVMLIEKSINQILLFIRDPNAPIPDYDIVTTIITVATVITKSLLFILCNRVQTPSCQALANDHMNDTMSNIIVIICGYIGSTQMREKTGLFELSYVDPVGAIFIGLYIVYSWWQTGGEQISLLTGHTASPEFLNKVTWLALNHSKHIKYLETIRGYHVGTNILVELHIVLSEKMDLKQAHDIGESLQQKIEKFPDVERAFVHVDYNFEHIPSEEHKII